ncbi:hypothetical protein BDQ94DRAFT_164370 [Aspergillus welwitschiae]|uniref:Uncharacterized protein n=1 Tax=Aspergillus welwitschiae TaxID=1341132 RepID=A0A3F3PJM7_9EURO|nr:hypothetical protein BDQ94DRAFT_164370 [Aspergillus welwitschiae]RDH26576.1 hypothetical protein BDQ94DRAFT_164370 [Aspergillus welwitschiae]
MPEKNLPVSASQNSLLRILLYCLILSTTIHYAHNYIRAEDYPPVPFIYPTPQSYRIAIIILYPLQTICGIRGYYLYKAGSIRTSIPFLACHSTLGIRTPGHFVGGVPQIPWFWFMTIWTDFFAGVALAVFCYKAYISTRG